MSTIHIPADLKIITDQELIKLLDRCQEAAGEVLDEFLVRVGLIEDEQPKKKANLRLVS